MVASRWPCRAPSSRLRFLPQFDRFVDHRLVGRILSAVLPLAPPPLVSEHLSGTGRQVNVALELGHVPPSGRAVIGAVETSDLLQQSKPLGIAADDPVPR